MSLIQRQEQAIAEMGEPRSGEKRAGKHRGAVIRRFYRHSLKLGYTEQQAREQLQDIRDMYALYQTCEE